MKQMKLLILIGILFFSLGVYGIQVCEWSQKFVVNGTNPKFSTLGVIGNNEIWVGTTDILHTLKGVGSPLGCIFH